MPSRSEIYLERIARTLQFNPIGTHSDGLNIAAVVELAVPEGATKIMIQTHTQNVRFTLDGTDPTATLGFQLVAAAPPVTLIIESRAAIKVIEEAATAVLQYQWSS